LGFELGCICVYVYGVQLREEGEEKKKLGLEDLGIFLTCLSDY